VSIINSPTSADLWLIDLQRVVTTRLTFDGLIATGSGSGATAVWAPDGSRVAYMYNRSGIYDVYQVLTNGTGKPEPLVQSNVVFKTPVAWSPDGKYLVWSQNVEPTQWDIWLLPMQGDRKPVPYLRTPFDETTAAISPDGRWLAHDSNETGRGEVYVRSFPEPREKHRVSTSGGTAAQWSRDGHELIFGTSGQLAYTVGSIFSVDVQTSPSFKAGTPRLLFSPRQDLVGITATSDLKRFLAAVPVEGSAPPSITVTMNWQTLLKR
jgi:serine/threonine-protein kinase